MFPCASFVRQMALMALSGGRVADSFQCRSINSRWEAMRNKRRRRRRRHRCARVLILRLFRWCATATPSGGDGVHLFGEAKRRGRQRRGRGPPNATRC